ncbi:MarR family winged helix-turn-helix transcriptional regulator [Xanthomonas hortorum]|uniref:MarR family winged helix-turn-helix transcriptional regulator n=1 Tax=Xanthomonas hortorum pv. hederae TaxID=453603 RepID=A0A9X3Z024_9XANT|nr:MarR family winged helix-turn-helix transcriptional regulator [Xanthomonas hortorum]MCE4370753.1 MarR family winged helix-turn-helix transcriptional regulator [Xanthomonas hortorum pv. hederae]MDC8637567.1 MarR family winged helix-turn-helix transcriptional regulator [Xanthomonas hortorum pv. hederae]PPU83648.1 MarR family transcriptional regulator [Xanthomonas hortorum pv. hederae]PUF00839.1 MarR family transcriptional regulator [Xanthomonas hortorum pv. hederae]
MKNAAKPQSCTNLKLRQLTRMVTRHYDRHVSDTGLKNTQYALLSHVVGLGPIRPGDLAKRMHMDASTLTRNLQPLVAHGWLKIGAGNDARSRLVEATEAGRAKRAEGQRAWKEAQVALNERLGIERVAALHELLEACIECLDDDAESVPDDGAELTGSGVRHKRLRR